MFEWTSGVLSSLAGSNPFFEGGFALMMVGVVLAALRRLPAYVAGLLQRQLTVSLEVADTEAAHEWLTVWLARHAYCKRARRLIAIERRSGTVVLSPASGRHWFLHGGRPVFLHRERRELDAPNYDGKAVSEQLVVRMLGRDQELLRKLLAEAFQVAERPAGEVSVHVPQGQRWRRLRRFQPRSLDTISLPEGRADALLKDVRDFLGAADWYQERGIPWRRGYLLQGLPGTGKTSIISAIAGELGLDLYVLNLAATMSDETLYDLLLGVPTGAAIVLEDVDAVLDGRAIVRGSRGGDSITFSGLLNALDGITAAGGQTRWLTTNHPERLDPALRRVGRVDVTMEFGHATGEQIQQMYMQFFREVPGVEQLAREFAEELAGQEVTPADVQAMLAERRAAPGAPHLGKRVAA